MSTNNYTTEINEIISLITKKMNLDYEVEDKLYKLIRSKIDIVLANRLEIKVRSLWKFRKRGLSVKAYLLLKKEKVLIINEVVKELS